MKCPGFILRFQNELFSRAMWLRTQHVCLYRLRQTSETPRYATEELWHFVVFCCLHKSRQIVHSRSCFFNYKVKSTGRFEKNNNNKNTRTNDKHTSPQPHPHPLLKFGYTLKSSTLLIQLDSRRLARSFNGYRTRIQIRLSVFALLDRNLDRCAQIWQTLAEDEVIIPHKTEAKESLTS